MVQQISFRSALWAMVIVLLFASAYYLYHLNAISFWEDESWLAIGMADGIPDLWNFAATRGVHPPLYFYLAYFLKPLIGDGEFAMRWTSGLCALVGLALTYRLGTEWFGRRTGVFAALLAAGSLFLGYLARLARQYTLFYALSAALMWAYARWYKQPTSWRWLLAITLLQAAALYTHYFSAFLAITIWLHALSTLHWKHTLRLTLALLVSALLFAPWIPSILTQLQGDSREGLDYSVLNVALILENYAGRVTNASVWLGAGLTLVGLVALIRERRWNLLWLFFLWIAVTFMIVILVNQHVFVWYIGRNLLYTFPAVVILYAAGLAHISRWRAGYWTAISAALVFCAYGLLAFSSFWPGTPGWRGIIELLARDARPDDIYVIDGEPYSTDYYLRRYLGARVEIQIMRNWQNHPQPVGERIWLIDSGQAVNFEAIDALPEGMLQTRRLVRLPVVAELYQLAPADFAVTFGEQLALGYTGTETITIQRGETLILDVWWQALRTPDFNYSATFQIWGEGFILQQTDGNFDSGRLDAQVLPVGLWTPDVRSLAIPADAAPGSYTLKVAVYNWQDGTRLAPDPAAPENLFTLAQIIIE